MKSCRSCPLAHQVQMLVAAGADLNKRDTHGLTAIHTCCLNGHLEVVKFLSSTSQRVANTVLTGTEKSKVRISRHRPPSPIEMAAIQGHVDTVMYLLRALALLGVSLEPVATKCSERAQDHQRTAVVDAIEKCKGWTALHFCCAAGDVERVSSLLGDGADPFAPDPSGVSAQEVAAKQDCGAVLDLLERALVWRPENHFLFPKVFRTSILVIMMTYHRMDGVYACVPYDLWLAMLSYLPRSNSEEPQRKKENKFLKKTSSLATMSKRVLSQGSFTRLTSKAQGR